MPTTEQTGVELIAAERERQVAKEGWTPEHDDKHTDGSLSTAAACYALGAAEIGGGSTYGPKSHLWPWGVEAWKPTPDNRIRELVKAGALIAAEIDRIQRLV